MATSTVTMFYIGNFADMDTDETDDDNENPNVVLGTYDNLAQVDIVQNDVDNDGVIYDDEYGTGDFLSYDTGAGQTSSNLDSSSLYNAEVLLGDGSSMFVRVVVIQASNGDVFISEYPPEPLDNLAIQSISLQSLNTSNALGITRGASDVQNTTVVCFGSGTLIATERGEIPVETLQIGDLVLTVDRGLQPVRWVRHDISALGSAGPASRPVLITADAIGYGIPAQDLIVSQQHRILVGGRGQLEPAFATEAFAPAKFLTRFPGIRLMNGKKEIKWVHFAFDQHEVVEANGCLAESLLIGPMVLKALSETERAELAQVFPTPFNAERAINGPAARHCLTRADVMRVT